jgi:TetR/AcrR family tetracycline transcriptional repressor
VSRKREARKGKMARDGERAGRKPAPLQREKIVQEALNLLNEVGLDSLTMRRLADRLEVQAAALYWHFKNKQELLDAMAGAILAASNDDIPEAGDWTQRVQAFAQGIRQTLLAYRDGAKLFAGTYTADYHTLHYTEIFASTLSQAGYPPASVVGAGWTIFYYVLGFTIEEQAFLTYVDADHRAKLANVLPDPQFPTLNMLRSHLGNWDFDARFRYGLNLLIKGLLQEGKERMEEEGQIH